MNDLASIAALLDNAAVEATAIPQLDTELTIDESYKVQKLLIGHRTRRGERQIGIKMGLTSKAKMAQVNVSEMSWGRLTDGMLIEDGGSLQMSRMVHPRAEPEIAFRLGRSLKGNVTAMEAWLAIEGVAPAIEIIDSRYKNFKFRASDVIADNSSSSALVVGPWHKPDIDFANLGMVLEIDGQPLAIASSAAILGHPIRSLVAASRLMALRGESLQVGDIVMSGGATAAEPLKVGNRVRVRVEKLGSACFQVDP